MITSTTHIEIQGASKPARYSRSRPASRRAFSLVELQIGLVIGAVVFAAVITSFLMAGRMSMSAAYYSESEKEVRRGIEEFSRDVRMARAIVWNGSTSITLTVPDNYTGNGNQVTYAYDAAATGDTAMSFYRKPGNAAALTTRAVLVRNVSSFGFARFNRLNSVAGTDSETKRIQITLNVRRARSTLVAANTTLVSASYTLRNKAIN